MLTASVSANKKVLIARRAAGLRNANGSRRAAWIRRLRLISLKVTMRIQWGSSDHKLGSWYYVLLRLETESKSQREQLKIQKEQLKEKDEKIELLGRKIEAEAKLLKRQEDRSADSEGKRKTLEVSEEKKWSNVLMRLSTLEAQNKVDHSVQREKKDQGPSPEEKKHDRAIPSPMEIDHDNEQQDENDPPSNVVQNAREDSREDGELSEKPDSSMWEERRRKTLILRGLENPNRQKVVDTLEEFEIVKGNQVSRVYIKNVAGKEWAFVQLKSEDLVEAGFKRRRNLFGTQLYIQKDLSKQVRLKLKEERDKKIKSSHQASTSFPNGVRAPSSNVNSVQGQVQASTSPPSQVVYPSQAFPRYPTPAGLPYPTLGGLSQYLNYPRYQYPNFGALAPHPNFGWAC